MITDSEDGAIVNTVSTAAQLPNYGMSAYGASKHAVRGLTKNAAVDYGGEGRVNSVTPRFIETGITGEIDERREDEMEQFIQNTTPLGRSGNPQEVEQALAEIQRVLSPGGRLYATTNGQSHLRELREVEATVHGGESKRGGHRFSLENGREQLTPIFETVDLSRHDDALVVPDADPLFAYSLSHDQFNASDTPALRAAFEERFENGTFRIQKDAGLFVAQTALEAE